MNVGSNVPACIVLNSWKEIANYVGRGVRTVQRWEADLGMPVRRPRAKSRSAVLAMSDEIDAWLRAAPTGELKPAANRGSTEAYSELHRSVTEHSNLRQRCIQLNAEHRESLTMLIVNIRNLADSIRIVGAKNSHLQAKTGTAPVVEVRRSVAFND